MIEISRGHFDGLQAALEECAQSNLYPSILIPEEDFQGNPVHWHDHDVHVFLLDGKAQVFDEEEQLITFEAGDKLLIPERTVHREAPSIPGGGAVVLIAFPKPMGPGQVVGRDPAEL